MPKLIHEEVIRRAEIPFSESIGAVQQESIERLFNIFSENNVFQSSVPQSRGADVYAESGTFGFSRLMDLSPDEVSFIAKASILEQLLFSLSRWDRSGIDEVLNMFLELEGDAVEYADIAKEKAQAVMRMLLLPTKCESSLLRRKLATGPGSAPYEALVNSHQERFMSSARLLHFTHAFIPKARAPPVSFSYL